MTDEAPAAPAPGLIGRVKALIFNPPAAWDALAQEERSGGAAFRAHAAPLALMMALAGLAGGLLASGFSLDADTVIVQPTAALLHLLIALIGVAAFASLAHALAPRFGAAPDASKALLLSSYGATGVLLGGFGAIAPPIAPYLLALGAAFSMVLVYIGLPRVMQAPENKRVGYFWSLMGVTLAGLLVVNVIYQPTMSAVRGVAHQIKFARAAPSGEPSPAQPALIANNVLDAAALRRLGEASAAGAGAPFDAARLEGFLPSSMPGGYELASRSTASSAPGAAQAEAVYAHEGARLVVTITHLGQRGALDVIDRAFAALQPRQDANGYARHQMTAGRLVAESQNAAAIHYAIIGRGVAIRSPGRAAPPSTTRALSWKRSAFSGWKMRS
jgi:hypothetical protein